MNYCYRKGDTLIEVMLAFAIFSLAAVGAMSVLSNGVATTQRDLEISLVREQVDSQAELLRYMHDTQHDVASSTWEQLIHNRVTTSPSPLSDSCTLPSGSSSIFYVQPSVDVQDQTQTTFSVPSITTLNKSATYAMIDYTDSQSRGIWIQVAKARGSSVSAYDFYIHACWDSVGVDSEMTSGTIVRIYE